MKEALLFMLLLSPVRRHSIEALEIKFERIICRELDPTFVTVEKCELFNVAALKDSASHEAKEINVRITLRRKPLENIAMVLQFYRRAKVLKPYNRPIALDVCAFLKFRSNAAVQFLFNFIEPYTNVNHTCPINHDVILTGLRSDILQIPYAPMPTGDYAFVTNWSSSGIQRLFTALHFHFDSS